MIDSKIKSKEKEPITVKYICKYILAVIIIVSIVLILGSIAVGLAFLLFWLLNLAIMQSVFSLNWWCYASLIIIVSSTITIGYTYITGYLYSF